MDSKPETAREALERWDAGQTLFTAEMGGIGPGYEQVIHIMAFEVIRELLAREPIKWFLVDAANEGDRDAERRWRAFTAEVETAVLSRIATLGSSGAQWGVAQSLAYATVRRGWRKSLDELPPERLIQVDKTWPRLEEQPAR